MKNLLLYFKHLFLIIHQFCLNIFLNIKKKLFSYINHIISFIVLDSKSMTDLSNFKELFLNQMSLSVEYIKIQELTFLSEYFLITALFCLTLFALFSLKLVVDEEHYLIKFQYNNQLIFLLIFVLSCYLILICQQMNMSLLALTSFNDTIYNDQLAFISKLIIGVSSILYLIFITQYLKDQKLSNFEYYIILLTSIFGFFLLCCANDLITAYLAIELQGLAFYVLASFKKSSNFSIESGVKYFVLGSLSTALFLFGITFIYGLSGSVILTDFKDFFIWVFSTNSFFLSFESIYKSLEIFQEKIDVSNNSEFIKLQSISDKLELLKNRAYFTDLYTESELVKSSFNDINMQSESSFISELKYWIDSNLFLKYQGFNENITKHDLLKTSLLMELVNNDFLTESILENALLDLTYLSTDKQLISESLIVDLKISLLNFDFYKSFGLNLGLEIKNLSYYLSQIDMNVSANLYLSFIQNYETLSNFSSIVSNNLILSDSKSYLFSTFNIFNINLFLSDFSNFSNMDDMLMFDFNFVVAGIVIVILALFFKLALAPFHLWAPDVYEGSPSSSTFFFMVISKFSIFVFLLRICYLSFYSLISYWQFYSLIVATVSIFIGAIAGLKQRRLKSLLTYSSINNMGFVLLAFSVGGFEGVQVKFYYLIVYMIASLCLWSIILNLKLKKKFYSEKQNRDLGDLALLQESNHSVAQSLGITFFTLAGLPPMVGFLAKMGVFKALTGVSIVFFSVINILFSVIATFYYLRIIKIIFFENLLIGNLYATISTKKTFLINLLTFFLVFLFISPMVLYLYSYKITLFLNKTFY